MKILQDLRCSKKHLELGHLAICTKSHLLTFGRSPRNGAQFFKIPKLLNEKWFWHVVSSVPLDASRESVVSQVCGSFSARAGVQAHVKMHHAHTNVIGLGDSSTWKIPFLPRSVYLFIAPLAVPIITPIVAIGEASQHLQTQLFNASS